MKIKDTVFLVTDREIIKTKVIGKKEVLSTDYDKKETIETSWLVITRDTGRTASDDWVVGEDLYPSLEAAQKVIQDRITAEIVDQLSKITVSDVTGGGNVK